MNQRILVVVDDDTTSDLAVEQGLQMASALRVDILFFYVLASAEYPPLEPYPMTLASPVELHREAIEQASKRLAAASTLAANAGVVSQRAMGSGGDAATCVATAAKNRGCRLIVAATERRNAVVRLLTGSIIPGLITHATVPVLVCTGQEEANRKAVRATPRQSRRRTQDTAT